MRILWFPLIALLGFSIVTSCELAQNDSVEVEMVIEAVDSLAEDIAFFQFTPDSSDFTSNAEINADYAYQLDSLTVVAGYNQFGDNEAFAIGDTEEDWGDRLYILNAEQEVLFQSKGVGEHYLFAPHFYRNNANKQVVIICQLAFEYFDGGEVFILENGEVNYLGNIDVTGTDMETSLIDIVKVQETAGELVFSFQADSVIVSLGSGDPESVGGSDISYRYRNGVFYEPKL